VHKRAGFAAKGDFENMVTYSTAQGYKPDYLYLMQRMMMDNPEAAVSPMPASTLHFATDCPVCGLMSLVDLRAAGQR